MSNCLKTVPFTSAEEQDFLENKMSAYEKYLDSIPGLAKSDLHRRPFDAFKQEELKIGRRCPECEEYATLTCNCFAKDSKCGNGHTWHIENGKVVSGKVNHAGDA